MNKIIKMDPIPILIGILVVAVLLLSYEIKRAHDQTKVALEQTTDMMAHYSKTIATLEDANIILDLCNNNIADYIILLEKKDD